MGIQKEEMREQGEKDSILPTRWRIELKLLNFHCIKTSVVRNIGIVGLCGASASYRALQGVSSINSKLGMSLFQKVPVSLLEF